MYKKAIVLKIIGIYIIITQAVMDFFVTGIANTLHSPAIIISTKHVLFYVLGFWIFTRQSKKFSLIMPLAIFSIFFHIQYHSPSGTVDTLKIFQALAIVMISLFIRYKWTASKVIASFIITSAFILSPAGFYYLTNANLDGAHVYKYLVFSEGLMLFSSAYIIFQKYINFVIRKDKFTKFSLMVKSDVTKIFLVNKDIINYSFVELHEAQEFNSIEIDSTIMIEVSYEVPLEKELPLKEVSFESCEQITEAQPRAPSYVYK